MAMKGPQVAMLVWLGNLAVLGIGGLLGYQFYTSAEDTRSAIDAARENPRTSEKIIKWQDTVKSGSESKHALLEETFLSPRERPKPPPPKPEPGPKPEPPKPDKTDEQLAKEVEDWLNREFMLDRLWFGPPSLASAKVIANPGGKAMLILRPEFNFKAEFSKPEYAKEKLAPLGKLDITVLAIERDGVLMKAPTIDTDPKYKGKYFDVKLKLKETTNFKPDGKLGKKGSIVGGNTRLPMPKEPVPAPPSPEEEDTRPLKSDYDEANDMWTIGREDYQGLDVDELAKYAKVVHDREGKPLGIQISDEIPEDNVVVSRGGRRGDIIKAINGKPVASMSDVRRVVREQYNAGIEEFRVDLERDGVPMQKVFRAPAKKKTEKDK